MTSFTAGTAVLHEVTVISVARQLRRLGVPAR